MYHWTVGSCLRCLYGSLMNWCFKEKSKVILLQRVVLATRLHVLRFRLHRMGVAFLLPLKKRARLRDFQRTLATLPLKQDWKRILKVVYSISARPLAGVGSIMLFRFQDLPSATVFRCECMYAWVGRSIIMSMQNL